MNEHDLRKAISGLPLGGVRFYKQTSSTNDAALAWAADGAPDLSLVYAEEQTAGRGRGGHPWFSPPGAGLAFSLVLKPVPAEERSIPLLSGLGALAVCQALGKRDLHPLIKWPNDVLLNGRKVSGILAESIWIGEKVDRIILGIGLNVRPESVPLPEHLNYPATSLEIELGKKVNRPALLKDILEGLLQWRALLKTPPFLQAWEKNLAFREELVEIRVEGGILRTGKLVGLEADGSLRLRSPDGQISTVQFGEVHLRQVV